jgi:hypothetical protein
MMRATGRKVRATGVTRLLYVLLALTVALTSLSVSATAADRVVGNPDGLAKAPEHGVNAIPEGAGGASDIKVEVIDTLSRYAVDLEIQTSKLGISPPSQEVWNVNTLQYEYMDTSAGTWYEFHQIGITVTNYSDKAILVEGTTTVSYPGCGYTLDGFVAQTVGGAFHGHETQAGKEVEFSTAFILRIQDWDDMVTAVKAKGAPDDCTLGTITIAVRPSTVN